MCTKINYINSKKKIAVSARTMDFASPTGQKFGLFKAGLKLQNQVNNSSDEFTTKYDFKAKFSDIGFNFAGKHYRIRTVSDGLNSAGLSLGTLWLPQTSFDSSVKTPVDCLSGLTLPQLILGTCATVADVIKLFEATPLVNHDGEEVLVGKKRVNVPVEYIQQYATIHLGLADPSGAQYVVEFETRDGKAGVPVFYKDPYGVLTNAPKFSWHKENLRNYVGLTEKFNITKGKIMGQEINTTGFGNNQRSLPGSGLPADRYVRAVILKSLALEESEPKDNSEAMLLLDKVIATVNVIKGTSANHGALSPDVDWTQWTTIHDMTNFRIYQKSDNDLGFKELICDPLKLECDTEMI
jgi:choloylglycine hydrolase